MTIKQCADCQDGEHENYDDDIKMVIIVDPDDCKRGFIKKSYMCKEHREMYDDDGYTVLFPC